MKVLAIFPQCDAALKFSSPYNGIIEAFEILGVPLSILVGSHLVGASMTEIRSPAVERHILNTIAELQPDLVISVNNHGMTKRVRAAISAPVVKWLFDDVEHYFVHESFGDWPSSFDPDDLVVCYSSELAAKVRVSCPFLRRHPVFLPHATALDLFRAFPADLKHNISFIGSYLDVGPVLNFLQHFGKVDPKIPLAIEGLVNDIRRNPQLDIVAALAERDLTDQISSIGVRPDDFKRVLSDLITTRDRLEAVTSLRDLGIAVYGRNDWVLPLIFQQGAEHVFQYDGKLGTQLDLIRAYQSTKITIDVPNVQNRTAIGGRVMEAMASDSLLITKHHEASDLYKVFGRDCPVPTYRDVGHLHSLCEHYLSHPKEREELVKTCQQLVSKGFDYTDRVAFILGLADLKAPGVRHRVASSLIREAEPKAVSTIGTDLDRFERAVMACVERGDIDEALNLLIVYVQACWHDPGTLTKLFGSARLDELCLAIGRAVASQDVADANSSGASVYIASHLAGHGGHTHVLESMVMADPTARRVILLTDVFNHADIATLAERFGRICEFRAPSRGLSLRERLEWLLAQLEELRPENTFLLNHHEDAVIISAMGPWLERTSVFFIHHADTNLCLGAHLPGAAHIDLHNIGFNCCRQHERIADNLYLPLSIKQKPSRPHDVGFRKNGELLTCSSGSYNKFSARYAFAYIDLIALRLQVDAGDHIHIGGVPPHELARLRSVLEGAGVDPDRFIHVPWVESVWTTLVTREVDLYISSFPLSGGLATIEAMGSGTPILAHESDMSRFHGGVDLMYPGVLTWRNAKQFETVIRSVSAERLARNSRDGVDWFERHHAPSVMGEQLGRILSGSGAEMQPPPLHEHQVDRLEQYRHFAVLGGGQEVGSVLAAMEEQKDRVLANEARESERLRRRVEELTRELEQVRSAQDGTVQTPDGAAGQLWPGSSLPADTRLVSRNGEWSFGVADDGRLTLRAAADGGALLWASEANEDASSLQMQFDGNLVLYDRQGAPCWASDTAGLEGLYLELRDDGALVLTNGWADMWTRPEVEPGAVARAEVETSASRLVPGAVMRMGEELRAPAGGHGLTLQEDGNLVLYRLTGDGHAHPVWASDTVGQDVELHLDLDGVLRLRNGDGREVWRPDAPRQPGAELEVTEDGAVLRAVDGRELWCAPATAHASSDGGSARSAAKRLEPASRRV